MIIFKGISCIHSYAYILFFGSLYDIVLHCSQFGDLNASC